LKLKHYFQHLELFCVKNHYDVLSLLKLVGIVFVMTGVQIFVGSGNQTSCKIW